MTYHGVTFDPVLDEARLNEQSIRVYRLMSDESWRSLGEISSVTGDPEASVSARLRDLRKPAFGGFTVDRQRRLGAVGLWEYRLQPAGIAPAVKVGRNPFLEGMKFAARAVLKAGDYSSAKASLAFELKKIATR